MTSLNFDKEITAVIVIDPYSENSCRKSQLQPRGARDPNH